MLEANVRDFSGNWTGTGEIANPGTDDIEALHLAAGEEMISEIVHTGVTKIWLGYNVYTAGDVVTFQYRHGATPAACVLAAWNNYVGIFDSLGYVQIRVASTL